MCLITWGHHSNRENTMIEVVLVTNDGAGLPRRIEVESGTSLAGFLDAYFDEDPDDFTVRIRSGGVNVPASGVYLLQNGDRVSLAPSKVDGAK